MERREKDNTTNSMSPNQQNKKANLQEAVTIVIKKTKQNKKQQLKADSDF